MGGAEGAGAARRQPNVRRFGFGVAAGLVTALALGAFAWWVTTSPPRYIQQVTLIVLAAAFGLAAGVVGWWRGSPQWYAGLTLLGLATAMLAAWTLGWRALGFAIVVATLLTSIARHSSVISLRIAALVAVVATLVALVGVGGTEGTRLDAAEVCRQIELLQGPTATGTPDVPCPNVDGRFPASISCADALGELPRLCQDPEGFANRMRHRPKSVLTDLRTSLIAYRQRDVDAATTAQASAQTRLATYHAQTEAAQDVLTRIVNQPASSADAVAAARQLVDQATATEATARDAVDAATAQLTKAQAALDAARSDAQAEELEVATLVADGANAIVQEALAPFVSTAVAARLGRAGWIILGLLLLVWYRRLEIESADREIGPVSIEAFQMAGDAAKDDKLPAFLGQKMRDWLARADVFEPSTVPTAANAEQLASVIANDDVPNGKWIGALINLFQRIAFPPGGVVVTPSYEDGAGSYSISVTLKSARRGQLIVSQQFTGPDLDHAIAQASAYVAQRTLAVASVVPPWAEWPVENGTSLERYQEARERERRADPDWPGRQRLLEAAIAANPASGLLRVELGNGEALAGDPVASVFELATAVAMFPRFLKARYRLGVTLSMLSAQIPTHWVPADEQDRREIVALLANCHDGLASAADADAKALIDATDEDEVKRVLIKLAEGQLRSGRRQVTAWNIAFRSVVHPRGAHRVAGAAPVAGQAPAVLRAVPYRARRRRAAPGGGRPPRRAGPGAQDEAPGGRGPGRRSRDRGGGEVQRRLLLRRGRRALRPCRRAARRRRRARGAGGRAPPGVATRPRRARAGCRLDGQGPRPPRHPRRPGLPRHVRPAAQGHPGDRGHHRPGGRLAGRGRRRMTTPDALDAAFAARLPLIAEGLKRELTATRVVRATLAAPTGVDRDTVGVAPAGGGFTAARVVASPAGVAIEHPAVHPIVRLTAGVPLDAATLADGPRLRAELAGLCRRFGQAEDAVLLHGSPDQPGLLAGSKPGQVWSGATNRAPVSSALTELRGDHVGAVDLLLPAWAMPRLDADPPRREWLAQQTGGTVAGSPGPEHARRPGAPRSGLRRARRGPARDAVLGAGRRGGGHHAPRSERHALPDGPRRRPAHPAAARPDVAPALGLRPVGQLSRPPRPWLRARPPTAAR